GRIHCAKCVDISASVGNANSRSASMERRSKTATGEVLFCGKRTFSQIQRQIFKEPTIVIVGLHRTFAERIDSHTQSWRPVISERIRSSLTGRGRATLNSFSLPTDTCESSDVLIHSPVILSVPGIVTRLCIKYRVAVFAAILSQID